MRSKRHLLTAALALFCLSAANAQLLRTTVEQGEIEGVEHEGFALYKGIPYAEAPVGNLRWKAPVSKISPAPKETAFFTHSKQSIPVGVLPPFI